jgi:hypothetical protein
MPRGGRREGAGRKPNGGRGRPVGAKNKSTIERLRLLDEARARGLDPIEFLLNEMDRLIKLGDEVSRDKARTIAKEVAQYCYPRLSTQNVTAIVEEKRHVIRVPKSRRRWTRVARDLRADDFGADKGRNR